MRVLDISRGIAGGHCAQMLALAGAEVTKVELVHPSLPAGGSPDALVRDVLNRGKDVREPAIELPAGVDALLEMVAQSDVVVEDLGAGALEACGLDEATLRSRQPALVLTRISEFGQSGPWADWPGSELINLAAGGLLFLTGPSDRPPVQLAPYQAQLTTGILGGIATLAAPTGGGGVTVDLSKQEAIAAMITPALTEYAYTGAIPAREGTVAGMTRIEMARDTWVYAGPSAPGNADYKMFGAFLEIPELTEERFLTVDGRMEHWEEHQALILPRIREKTAREWTDAAEKWRLTFGYVQTTTDLLACDVLAERDFFGPVETAEGTARVPLAPYLVDGRRPGAQDDAGA